MTKFRLTILIFIILAVGVVVSGCIKKPALQPNVNQPVNANQNVNVNVGDLTSENSRQELISAVLGNRLSKDFIIKIGNVEGNFAIGSINAREGGGAIWIAKIDDGKWKVIFESQEYIQCDLLKKNNVPETIYKDKCLLKDSNGQQQIVNYSNKL